MSSQAAYVTPAHIRETLDVSQPTLLRWANIGLIRCIRGSDTGRRLYNKEDVAKRLGVNFEDTKPEKKVVVYARVSSQHQKEDLERQCQALKDACGPNGVKELGGIEPDLITDIASGLNWKRHGLTTLLDQIYQGVVSKVVVTHRDRLARIGVELIEWILEKHNVKLVVLSQTINSDETSELRDDLLAITTFFVARHNGLRSATNRRARKNKDEGSKDTKQETKIGS
jgi:predicted site-specific integrase-resolvase